MGDDFTSRTALEAIKIIKPKLVVNGDTCTQVAVKPTHSPRGQSTFISQATRERCYLVIGNDNVRSVEIWRDFEKINILDV